MSKYKEIANMIEEKIVNGFYDETNKLPTEDVLIKEYQSSRNTIRNAINHLMRRGFVVTVQGSGVFLRKGDSDGAINLENFYGLTKQFKNKKVTTKLISLELKKPSQQLVSKLKCNPETLVYHIKRLRFVDGDPFVVEYTYYNSDVVPNITEKIAQTSIFSYIREKLKLEIGYVDMIISADILDSQDAILLGLEDGMPSINTENVEMLKNGKIFACSKDVHHYRRAKFLKLSNYI